MAAAVQGGSGKKVDVKPIINNANEVNRALDAVDKVADKTEKVGNKVAAVIKGLGGKAHSLDDIITSFNTKSSKMGKGERFSPNVKGFYAGAKELQESMEIVYKKLTEQKSQGLDAIESPNHGQYEETQRELVNMARALSAVTAINSGEDLNINPKVLKEQTERFLQMANVSQELQTAYQEAVKVITSTGKGGSKPIPLDTYINSFLYMRGVEQSGRYSEINGVSAKLPVKYEPQVITPSVVDTEDSVEAASELTSTLDLLYKKLKAIHDVDFDLSKFTLSLEEQEEALKEMAREVDEIIQKADFDTMSKETFQKISAYGALANRIVAQNKDTISKSGIHYRQAIDDHLTDLKLDKGFTERNKELFVLNDKGEVDFKDSFTGEAQITDKYMDELDKAADEVTKIFIKKFEAIRTMFNDIEIPQVAEDYGKKLVHSMEIKNMPKKKDIQKELDLAEGYMIDHGISIDPKDAIFEMLKKQRSTQRKNTSGTGGSSGETTYVGSIGLDPEQIEAIEGMIESLEAAVEQLTKKIGELGTKIEEISKSSGLDAISSTIQTLEGTIGKLPGIFNKDTFDSIEKVISDLSTLQESLKKGFKIGESDDLKQYFKDLGTSTGTVVTNLREIAGHLEHLSAIGGTDKTALLGVTTEQISAVNGAFGTLRTTLQDVYKLLNEKIKLNPNEIRNFMANITDTQSGDNGNKAASIVQEKEQRTNNEMQTPAEPVAEETSASNWFANIRQTAQRGLDAAKATEQAYQDGLNLATGYAGGTEAGIPRVTEAATNLTDNVKSTVQKNLGIQSPSRVFYEYGEYCVLGFIEGIKESKSKLIEEIKDLTDPASIEKGLAAYFNKGGSVNELQNEFAEYLKGNSPRGVKKEDTQKASNRYFEKIFAESKNPEHIKYQPIDEKEYEYVGALQFTPLIRKITKDFELTAKSYEALRDGLMNMVDNVMNGEQVDFESIKTVLSQDANIQEGAEAEGQEIVDYVNALIKKKSANYEKNIIKGIRELASNVSLDKEIPEPPAEPKPPKEKKPRTSKKKTTPPASAEPAAEVEAVGETAKETLPTFEEFFKQQVEGWKKEKQTLTEVKAELETVRDEYSGLLETLQWIDSLDNGFVLGRQLDQGDKTLEEYYKYFEDIDDDAIKYTYDSNKGQHRSIDEVVQLLLKKMPNNIEGIKQSLDLGDVSTFLPLLYNRYFGRDDAADLGQDLEYYESEANKKPDRTKLSKLKHVLAERLAEDAKAFQEYDSVSKEMSERINEILEKYGMGSVDYKGMDITHRYDAESFLRESSRALGEDYEEERPYIEKLDLFEGDGVKTQEDLQKLMQKLQQEGNNSYLIEILNGVIDSFEKQREQFEATARQAEKPQPSPTGASSTSSTNGTSSAPSEPTVSSAEDRERKIQEKIDEFKNMVSAHNNDLVGTSKIPETFLTPYLEKLKEDDADIREVYNSLIEDFKVWNKERLTKEIEEIEAECKRIGSAIKNIDIDGDHDKEYFSGALEQIRKLYHEADELKTRLDGIASVGGTFKELGPREENLRVDVTNFPYSISLKEQAIHGKIREINETEQAPVSKQTVTETPVEGEEAALEKSKDKIKNALAEIIKYYQDYADKRIALYKKYEMLFSWTDHGEKDAFDDVSAKFKIESGWDHKKPTPEIKDFRDYVQTLLSVKKDSSYVSRITGLEGNKEDAQQEIFSLFGSSDLDTYLTKALKDRVQKIVEKYKEALQKEGIEDVNSLAYVPTDDFYETSLDIPDDIIQNLFKEKLKGIIPEKSIQLLKDSFMSILSGTDIENMFAHELDIDKITSSAFSSYVSAMQSEQAPLEEVIETTKDKIQEFKQLVENFGRIKQTNVHESFLTPYITMLENDEKTLSEVYDQFEADFNEMTDAVAKFKAYKSDNWGQMIDDEDEINGVKIEDNKELKYYDDLIDKAQSLIDRAEEAKIIISELEKYNMSDEDSRFVNFMSKDAENIKTRMQTRISELTQKRDASTLNPANAPKPAEGTPAPSSGESAPEQAAAETEHAAQSLEESEKSIKKSVTSILTHLQKLRDIFANGADSFNGAFTWNDFSGTSDTEKSPLKVAKDLFNIGTVEGNDDFRNYVTSLVNSARSKKNPVGYVNMNGKQSDRFDAEKEIYAIFAESHADDELAKIVGKSMYSKIQSIVKSYLAQFKKAGDTSDKDAETRIFIEAQKIYDSVNMNPGDFLSKHYGKTINNEMQKMTESLPYKDQIDPKQLGQALISGLNEVSYPLNEVSTLSQIVNVMIDAYNKLAEAAKAADEATKKTEAIASFRKRMEDAIKAEGVTVENTFLDGYIAEAEKDITKINEIYDAFFQNLQQLKQRAAATQAPASTPASTPSQAAPSEPSAPASAPVSGEGSGTAGGGADSGAGVPPDKSELDKKLAMLKGLNEKFANIAQLEDRFYFELISYDDDIDKYIQVLSSITDDDKALMGSDFDSKDLVSKLTQVRQASALQAQEFFKGDIDKSADFNAGIKDALDDVTQTINGVLGSVSSDVGSTYIPQMEQFFKSLGANIPYIDKIIIAEVENLNAYFDNLINKGNDVIDVLAKLLSDTSFKNIPLNFGTNDDDIKNYVEAKKKKNNKESYATLYSKAAEIREKVNVGDSDWIAEHFNVSNMSGIEADWHYIRELILEKLFQEAIKELDNPSEQDIEAKRSELEGKIKVNGKNARIASLQALNKDFQYDSNSPSNSGKGPVSNETQNIVLTPTLDEKAWKDLLVRMKSTPIEVTVIPQAQVGSPGLIQASIEQQIEKNGNIKVPVEVNVKDDALGKEEQRLRDNNKKITVDADINSKTLEESAAQVTNIIDGIPSDKEIRINIVNYDQIPMLTDSTGNLVNAFRGISDAFTVEGKNGWLWFTSNLETAASYAEEINGKVIKANLAFNKPLEIDAKGAMATSIPYDNKMLNPEEIGKLAKEQGYDSVIFRNVKENGEELTNMFLALDKMQVKNQELVATTKEGAEGYVLIAKSAQNAYNSIEQKIGEIDGKVRNVPDIDIQVTLDDKEARDDIDSLERRIDEFHPLQIKPQLEQESLNTLLSDINSKIPKEMNLVVDIQDVQKQKEEADNKTKNSAKDELVEWQKLLSEIESGKEHFLSLSENDQGDLFSRLDGMIDRLSTLKEQLRTISTEGNPFLEVSKMLNVAMSQRSELYQMQEDAKKAPAEEEKVEEPRYFKSFEELQRQITEANEWIEGLKGNIESIGNVVYKPTGDYFGDLNQHIQGSRSQLTNLIQLLGQIPDKIKNALSSEGISFTSLASDVGEVTDAVKLKTAAFEEEKKKVNKVVAEENKALTELEGKLAKVAGAATGQLGIDTKKNFAQLLSIYKQTSNVAQFKEALDEGFRVEDLQNLYNEAEFGLKKQNKKYNPGNVVWSRLNKPGLIDDISNQIQAMYPPSKQVVKTIAEQYKEINKVFETIQNTLKAINDGIDALNTKDLDKFIENFQKLQKPLEEYWTGDLSDNNILLVIRDIVDKGGALESFAKVLASSEAKLRKTAEQAKKSDFEQKTGVKLNSDGSANTEVMPWQDWKDAAESYKNELGEILKVTEEIKDIKLFDEEGNPILDDDGNQQTERMVVSRTFYGTEKTGFERSIINKQGELEGVKMESFTDTPLNQRAIYKKETLNATLDKYIADLKEAGKYSDELAQKIEEYREKLENKTTTHAGLEEYTEDVKKLDAEVKQVLQDSKTEQTEARKLAQDEYKREIKAVKELIAAQTELNKLRAASNNPKTTYTVTQEDLNKAQERIDRARDDVAGIRQSVVAKYDQGLISGSQYVDAMNLLNSDDFQEGSRQSVRAQRNASTKAEIDEITTKYKNALKAVKDLSQARVDLNKIEADSIANGEETVTNRRTEALNREADATKRVADARKEMEGFFAEGKISQEQYEQFTSMANGEDFDLRKNEAASKDEVTQKLIGQYKLLEKAIEQYETALLRVQDIQDALANGSQVTGRLKSNMTTLTKANEKLLEVYKKVDEIDKRYNIDRVKESISSSTGKQKYEVRDYGGVPGLRDLAKRIKVGQETYSSVMDQDYFSSNSGYENAKKGYETLAKYATNYYKILAKLQTSSGSVTTNENLFMQRHQEYFELANDKHKKFISKLGIKKLKMEDLNKAQQEFVEANTKAMMDVAGSQADSIGQKLDVAKEIPLNEQTRAFQEQFPIIQKQYDDLQKKIMEFDWNGKSEKDFENLMKDIQKVRESVNTLTSENQYKVVNELQLESLDRKMSEWSASNSAAYESIKKIKDLQSELRGTDGFVKVDDQGRLNEIAASFERIKSEAFEAGEAGLSFGDKLKGSMGNLARYLLSFNSYYRIIGTLRQGISIVKELDSALVEMSKTSDATRRTLQAYQKETFTMADTLGTTSVQIQQSTADWTRLGYSLENAAKMSQLAIKLLNVSEFNNVSEATQALVSATQAYKDIDPESMVNKLNLVGNNFAVSTSELAQGLQNAAAVLVSQNVSFDEALALLTSGNAVTQDISKTSAGIRTIALRIAGTEQAKEELAELDGEVEDFVVRTKSKTDSIIRNYTAVASNAYQGVSVLDANGNLRNTYDIEIMCPHMRNLCA